MESTDQNNQGTCQGTERSPHLTNIKHLPDEVLLDIFDIYRQSINRYDYYWRKNSAWFNLAHVCIRWRAVMFASSSRLDLNVVVGPIKPGHIMTCHLPIIIDYPHSYTCGQTDWDAVGSALWRLSAVLGYCDRVHEISFEGCVAFEGFIRETNYHFPALETLTLSFPHGHEPDIPATFLKGPDRSDIRLRRLELYGSPLTFSSRLLSSVTALTDITLSLGSEFVHFDLTQGLSFLACLQGMQSLRSLDLTTRRRSLGFFPLRSQHSVSKEDPVLMPELTRIHYSGLPKFLDNLMSGLSTPFLQDVHFVPCTESSFRCLSRVIEDVREEFRSVSIAFDMDNLLLLSSTHLGEIDCFKPSSFKFRLNMDYFLSSINSMSKKLSTKLAMAEELTLNFQSSSSPEWDLRDQCLSMCKLLRQFRGVRVLRVNPFVEEIGHRLRQNQGRDDRKDIFPVLEKIGLSISRFRSPDEKYELCAAEALAAFEPCERVGCLVKVYHSEQTVMQDRNTEPW